MADERDDELETIGTPGDAVPQRLLKEVSAQQDAEHEEDEEDEVEDPDGSDEEE